MTFSCSAENAWIHLLLLKQRKTLAAFCFNEALAFSWTNVFGNIERWTKRAFRQGNTELEQNTDNWTWTDDSERLFSGTHITLCISIYISTVMNRIIFVIHCNGSSSRYNCCPWPGFCILLLRAVVMRGVILIKYTTFPFLLLHAFYSLLYTHQHRIKYLIIRVSDTRHKYRIQFERRLLSLIIN